MKQQRPDRSDGSKRQIKPRRRSSDLEFVEIDGEIVIYDETDDSIHHLNPTASMIWQACDGTATTRELALEFAKAAGLPQDQIERDITAAVRQLAGVGLMEVPKRRKNAAAGGPRVI